MRKWMQPRRVVDAFRTCLCALTRWTRGEREVGERLDVLHGAGWHVLHDRRKNARSPANLDHVLVGPPGVVVIDAKNWSGGLLQLDDRGMKLGSWRKDDALHAAKVDADLVRAMSGRVVPEVQCVGLLAFVQDVGLAAPVLHRDVVLAQQSQLLPWLAQLPRRLSIEQVDAIAARLEQELVPRSSSKAARSSRPAPAPATWAPSSQDRPPGKAQSKQQRKRAKAGRELRAGLVKLTVLGLVVVSLPVTFPVLEDHVLTPIAQRLASSLDGMQPAPSADRTGPGAPADGVPR